MATLGQIGSGVKVAYATGTPHTWVEITQIMNCTIPNRTRDRVETTIHGVTGDRTYIPGLSDVEDAELELLADLDATSSHMALEALERSQATTWFRFEVPNESTLSTAQYFARQIQGRVAGWTLNTPIDGAKTITVTIQFAANMMTQLPMASQF